VILKDGVYTMTEPALSTEQKDRNLRLLYWQETLRAQLKVIELLAQLVDQGQKGKKNG